MASNILWLNGDTSTHELHPIKITIASQWLHGSWNTFFTAYNSYNINTTFPGLQKNIQTRLNQAKHSEEAAAISFNANIMMADYSRPPRLKILSSCDSSIDC
jgi:hypothetical protein